MSYWLMEALPSPKQSLSPNSRFSTLLILSMIRNRGDVQPAIRLKCLFHFFIAGRWQQISLFIYLFIYWPYFNLPVGKAFNMVHYILKEFNSSSFLKLCCSLVYGMISLVDS